MLKLVALFAAAALLGGCATVTSIDSEVTAYSQWPVGRKPSTYVFERLPSQQAEPARQQQLEGWARPAIESAGFVAVATRPEADVTIQLGARITVTDTSPFADPFWWGGWRPWGYGWHGRGWDGGWRYGWGPRLDPLGYEREAALLIRDRRNGEPLYQARASSVGFTSQLDSALPAMFEAALNDFPHGNAEPHVVSIEPGAPVPSR